MSSQDDHSKEIPDDDTAFLSIANELLAKCNITSRFVTRLEDCTDEFFIDVYEGLFGDDLPGVVRRPLSREERALNCQTVINILQDDILGMDLSHITGRGVVEGDAVTIHNLLEIFAGLLEYIMEGVEIDLPEDSHQGDEDSDILSSDHEVISDVIREELGSTFPETVPFSVSLQSGALADDSKETNSTAELIKLGETGSSLTPGSETEIMRAGTTTTDSSTRHEPMISSQELQTDHSAHVTSSTDTSARPVLLQEPRGSSQFMARTYKTLDSVGSLSQVSILDSKPSSSATAAKADSGTESDSTGELIRDSERVEAQLARERLERQLSAFSVRHTVPPPVSRSISQLSRSLPGSRRGDVDPLPSNQPDQTDAQASPPHSPRSSSSSVSWPKEISPLDPQKDGACASGCGNDFDYLGVRPLPPSSDGEASSGRSTPVYHHHCHHHYHHMTKNEGEADPEGKGPTVSSLATAASSLRDSVFASSSGDRQDRGPSAARNAAGSGGRPGPSSVHTTKRNPPERDLIPLLSSQDSRAPAKSKTSSQPAADFSRTFPQSRSQASTSTRVLRSQTSSRQAPSTSSLSKEQSDLRQDDLTRPSTEQRTREARSAKRKELSSSRDSTRNTLSSIDDSTVRRLMKEYDKEKETHTRSSRKDILSEARRNMSQRLSENYRQELLSDSDENLSQCSDSVIDYQNDSLSPERSLDPASARALDQDSPSSPPRRRSKRAVTFRDDVDLFPVTSRMDRLRRELEEEDKERKKTTQRLQSTYRQQLKGASGRKRPDQNSPRKSTKRRKLKRSPTKRSSDVPRSSLIRGRSGRPPLAQTQQKTKQRKRSASASPTMSRRRKLTDEHKELLPLLLDEFPFLHVSPETAHKMWRKQMHILDHAGKSAVNVEQIRTQRMVDEAERRQELQARILRKEMDHNQRLRELKDREQQERAVKMRLQEKRTAAARARRYYEDYHVRMKSRMLKRRTREEQIFKKLFDEGLHIQKERIRELRKYAQEKRESQARKQREEIQALENYYGDQFEMLAETMAEERKDLELRDKAQNKVLQQMRRELRKKMEKEVQEIQDQLSHDQDPAYIRQLEADRLRRHLQLSTYKTYF